MFEGLFQPMHMLIILIIVLLIFGPGKLPELGEGLGKSIQSFKKAMREGQETAVDGKKEEKAL
jgi:sec-independent protein translocase protein TatA